MSIYNIVASTDEATVVAEYVPDSNAKSSKYQSEAELEREFIELLVSQGYEYLNIKSEKDLITNLRKQLEKLNNYQFTDNEWNRFFNEVIANANEGVVEKTRKIQTDHIQILNRDDGTTKNIYLIDKRNIHNNKLQVINQYTEPGGKYETRYDVTILVNGFPIVHVELKRRGVAIREAFNQIKRYQRDSFWAASGLFEYVHIFVISNGTHTKYYSNTTRNLHIKEQIKNERSNKKTSNSFEFTSFWADANNKIIPDLVDFTKTFFSKHTILNILTKYCVFTSENMLLVMRPYQIAATESILSRIIISTNYKKVGTIEAGGYIWHTTGSGKTLTSFKTAQLAASLPFIDKVLFVVDRKDLDYQTMKEYDRYEKGAANGNTSTRILQRQLEDRDEKGNYHEYKIIVTTIQKLDLFIRKNKQHDVYKKHVVIIFYECHRSQFGSMHQAIVKSFKNYHLFGFTGTPIFAVNSRPTNSLYRTTEQVFGERLHTYTIVDSINDGNVLPFRIDFINTIKKPDNVEDKLVSGIDYERALADPQRISEIVNYVLEHFDQKTKRSSFYTYTAKWEERDKYNPRKIIEKRETRRLAGFNSIFAADSIPMAIKYYKEFKKQIQEKNKDLIIATIFSFSPNEETENGLLPDEEFDVSSLEKSYRDFLEEAIKDYNETFNTNFDTSADKFENYYKDLSLRMKNREIDILIVVNMF
ncbi:MAG: type I restriction endonuclease subunit R, partial [Bacilli bacterium]|nr:type I restriction endonuclease subunit R [Bacilli bacterium]